MTPRRIVVIVVRDAARPLGGVEFLGFKRLRRLSFRLNELHLLPIRLVHDAIDIVAFLVHGDDGHCPFIFFIHIGHEESVPQIQLAHGMNVPIASAVSGGGRQCRNGLTDVDGKILTENSGKLAVEGELRAVVAIGVLVADFLGDILAG